MDELPPEQATKQAEAKATFERAIERAADDYAAAIGADELVVNAHIEAITTSRFVRSRRLRWRFARNQAA